MFGLRKFSSLVVLFNLFFPGPVVFAACEESAASSQAQVVQEEEEDVCYLCQGNTNEAGQLFRPCSNNCKLIACAKCLCRQVSQALLGELKDHDEMFHMGKLSCGCRARFNYSALPTCLKACCTSSDIDKLFSSESSFSGYARGIDITSESCSATISAFRDRLLQGKVTKQEVSRLLACNGAVDFWRNNADNISASANSSIRRTNNPMFGGFELLYSYATQPTSTSAWQSSANQPFNYSIYGSHMNFEPPAPVVQQTDFVVNEPPIVPPSCGTAAGGSNPPPPPPPSNTPRRIVWQWLSDKAKSPYVLIAAVGAAAVGTVVLGRLLINRLTKETVARCKPKGKPAIVVD